MTRVKPETEPKPVDKIFTNAADEGSFVFDSRVAEVFENMLARSIPMYTEIQRMITEDIVPRLVKDSVLGPNEGVVYDMGCSIGTTLAALRTNPSLKGVKLIGWDSSPAMISRCGSRLGASPDLDLVCGDVSNCRYKFSSIAIFSLILQFLPSGDRDLILHNCYVDGVYGVVIVEKIIPEVFWLDDWYHDFKHRMGYSWYEIEQKRRALKGVMMCDTYECLVSRCEQASWRVIPFFRWNNFVGLLLVR